MQGVEQRNRGVAIGAGIQDHSGKTARSLLNPGDHLAFAVALPTFDQEIKLDRLGAAHCLDVGKRGPAIDVWLPAPEQIEVGAVENQNVVRHRSPVELGALSSVTSRRLAM